MLRLTNTKKLIAGASIFASALTAAPVPASAATPTHEKGKVHQQMQDRGYGMFIHFGPNTFLNQEWNEGLVDTSIFRPDTIDADQWVRVARDAGFRYVLLVTKHHDGFCLWPSAYTDYDVESSPVKTDVVGAVAEACKKYGLKFAVYYSLWDRHEPTYTGKDFKKYVKYMKNQLTELMSGYGDICELWLDGAWDKKCSDWQLQELYDLVKNTTARLRIRCERNNRCQRSRCGRIHRCTPGSNDQGQLILHPLLSKRFPPMGPQDSAQRRQKALSIQRRVVLHAL